MYVVDYGFPDDDLIAHKVPVQALTYQNICDDLLAFAEAPEVH